MSEDTTPQTAKAATIPAALPLNSLQLLGVFTNPKGARALIRAANGAVTMGQAGTQLPGGEVTLVADSHVMVRQGNRDLRLEIPG